MGELSIVADDPAILQPLIGAGVSFWVVLAIFIGSAILERRKKRAATDSSLPVEKRPPSRASRRPEIETRPEPVRTAAVWEEELRRLLGVEPTPPTPPPVSRRTVDRPAPPPLRTSATPTPSPILPAQIESKFPGAHHVSTIQLPELRESAAAYQQASRLQEQVAGRLKQLEERMQRHSPPPEPARAASVPVDAASAVAWFRDRRNLRQAVIASVILAPPQGLETS